MSEQEANIVTHDSFGNEPTTDVILNFGVVWSGETYDQNKNVRTFQLDTRKIRDWNSFKRALLVPAGHSIDDQVTYIDGDNDRIPIESQCEFEESLRIAKILVSKGKDLKLIVERGLNSGEANIKKNFHNPCKVDSPEHKDNDIMPPMNLDNGVQDFISTQRRNETNNVVEQPELADDPAPKWFTNYMQTMKEDIVAEVSTRVTKTVMEALQKKRDSQYDSATSHPRASDSDYFVDSDFDDDRWERYSTKSRDDKIIIEDLALEKKNSDASLRSGAHCYGDTSRRHYRNAEKQRKMSNKSNVSQASNKVETTSQRCQNSSSLNRRRGEKISKKREDDDARVSLTRSMSENSRRSEQVSAPKSIRDNENFDEEFDTPYRRMIASGIREMSFTPVDSTDLLDAPILKLRLADSCHVRGQNVETTKLKDEKLRMGCSVTGNDMLDRPNDRVPEYCALSDSDNISIISDVSHSSDIQRISNSFEMILQRSMNLTDEADNDRDFLITTEFVQNNDEQFSGDLDATRDSSSFELLSEPPSPPLSIHMDEDHFSPGTNETKNYNINDDTTMDKRGNQDKIECYLAFDEQGKIYARNVLEIDEEPTNIILEKRTDGTYSFVGDKLPGSTRETMIQTERSNSASTDETITVTESIATEIEHEKTTEIPNEMNLDDKSPEEKANDAFHESTQSFNSHTAPKTENERKDFAECPSTSGHDETSDTPRSHIFIDHNASKGLGDTRQSSPRKQGTNRSQEDFGTERPRTSRKPSHNPNHGSTRRNGNSRQPEGSTKFVYWSTAQRTRIIDEMVLDGLYPMHLLPETLVTGAVHVAASAYTTARRVYDKIITVQTRKPADKSKFGRR